MKKLSLILLAFALACGLGAVLWRSLTANAVPGTVSQGEERGVAHVALAAPSAPSAPSAPGDVTEAPEPPPAAREAVAAEGAASLSVTLRGTAVARMAGVEYGLEAGRFRIHFDLTDRAQAVEVRGGRWECEMEVPAGTSLAELGRASISSVVLRSRGGDPFPETIALSADRELAVGCLWSGSHLLHVLDAKSGAHLAGVRVLPASAGRLPPAVPASSSPGEGSPFVFEPNLRSLGGDDVRAWWVGASEHEWARIALDHRRGGDRTVSLRRAGELQVTWTGTPPAGPVLDVRALDGPLADRLVGRQLLAGGPPALFTGLAPGRFGVELHRMSREGRLLLSRETRVRAGERTSLHLHLEPLANAPELVPLGGTLQVHSGWRGLGGLSLAVRRDDPAGAGGWGTAMTDRSKHALGEVTAREGAGDVRPWKSDAVLPGRFRIEVRGPERALLLQEWIQVGPVGATNVALVIDAPTAVAIDVREGAAERPFLTGASSPGRRGLSISYRLADSDASYRRVSGELDGATGVFHARMPRGEWELSIFHEDYAWVQKRLALNLSQTSVTVVLRSSCTLELRLVSEGWRVPVEREWFRAIEITDFEGEPLPFGSETVGNSPGRARLSMEDRSPCRLVFPPVNGFAPIAPIEATLSSESPTVLEFELERLLPGQTGTGERR